MDPVAPIPEPELELEPNPARTYALLGLATLAGVAALVLILRGVRGRVAAPASSPAPLDLDELEELSPALRSSFEHLAHGIEQRLEAPLEKVAELERLVGTFRVELAALTGADNVIPRERTDPLDPPPAASTSTNGAEALPVERPDLDLDELPEPVAGGSVDR